MAFAQEVHSGSAQVAKDGTVTYTRTFLLDTGNAATRPAWAVIDIGINKYDPHPDDSSALAIEVNSTPGDTLGWFTVVYTYSNRPLDDNTTDGTGDPGKNDPTQQPEPTLWTPEVRWSSNKTTVAWTGKDWSVPVRKALQNSAGQPYEGLTREECTTVMDIKFWLNNVDIAAKQDRYVNTDNNANFTLIPGQGAYAARRLRCNAWNGSLKYFPEVAGWRYECEVQMEYKRGGWNIEVLDAGYYESVPDATLGLHVQKKIVNPVNGQPPDGPVKLNGAGLKLADGAANVYHTFWMYESINWAAIFA